MARREGRGRRHAALYEDSATRQRARLVRARRAVARRRATPAAARMLPASRRRHQEQKGDSGRQEAGDRRSQGLE